MGRIVLGLILFFVLPIIPTYVSLMSLGATVQHVEEPTTQWELAFYLGAVLQYANYIVMTSIFLFLLIAWSGHWGLKKALATGFFVGLFICFSQLEMEEFEMEVIIGLALAFGGYGALMCLIFWMIAMWKNAYVEEKFRL